MPTIILQTNPGHVLRLRRFKGTMTNKQLACSLLCWEDTRVSWCRFGQPVPAGLRARNATRNVILLAYIVIKNKGKLHNLTAI